MGPVSPRHVGSSQTRARTRVPCIGRQIPNHCATREALPISLNSLGRWPYCPKILSLFQYSYFSFTLICIVLTVCSSELLHRRGESIHLCLVPVFNGSASNISHLSMFAVDIRKGQFPSNLNLLKVVLMLNCFQRLFPYPLTRFNVFS